MCWVEPAHDGSGDCVCGSAGFLVFQQHGHCPNAFGEDAQGYSMQQQKQSVTQQGPAPLLIQWPIALFF